MISCQEIMELLPHRYPFLLVDRIVEMEPGKRIAYFTGIDNVKFRRPVVPGDQLRLEITVLAHKGPLWKMHGEALVDGALAAKGDVTATVPDGVGPGGEEEVAEP